MLTSILLLLGITMMYSTPLVFGALGGGISIGKYLKGGNSIGW